MTAVGVGVADGEVGLGLEPAPLPPPQDAIAKITRHDSARRIGPAKGHPAGIAPVVIGLLSPGNTSGLGIRHKLRVIPRMV